MPKRAEDYPDYPDRIAAKFTVLDSGCWEWTAAKLKTGYGCIRVRGRTCRIHRIVYEMFVEPIPEGMVIDHLCRNKLCINPDHLEVVTHRENSLRGNMRMVNYLRETSKTHCRNGHEYTPENTQWAEWQNSRVCLTCSREKAKRYRERQKAASAP